MRDLVWTIIFIWLAYKIFEMFKGFKNNNVGNHNDKDGDVKINQGTHQPGSDKFKDAEYVDYEEIKNEN